MISMRTISFICLFLTISAFASTQEQESAYFRGSIPDELMMPRRGESPRYPIDTVIGELGQGSASARAYSFANSIAAGFLSGKTEHPSLDSINSVLRENYLSALDIIDPFSFRLGSGRNEPDGAVSFMIRFIGRDQGITGELFVRFISKQIQQVDEETNAEINSEGNWIFEELILEEAKNHDAEPRDSFQHFDFSPYERFF